MKAYVSRFDYHLTAEAEKGIDHLLQNRTVHGNGRFAVNLIRKRSSFRPPVDERSDIITDIHEVTMIEKEDIEKAFIKIAGGEQHVHFNKGN